MNCTICGTATEQHSGEYEYESLRGTLLIGIPAYVCPQCGAEYVSIPQIEQLNRMLASEIIRQRGRLSPAEIVFLRKYLGWSAGDLALRLDVDPSTVSRWENGKQRMSVQAERLLRLLAHTQKPVQDYQILDDFNSLASKDVAESPPPRWRYDRGWHAEAA